MSDMPLSRLARDLAAEINYHDWSDAPFRADRAGHQRHHDGRGASSEQLTRQQTDTLRMNAMWAVAQVLGHHDPNFDVYRFAEACGVDTSTPSGRPRSGGITAGLRHDSLGRHAAPVLALFCCVCDRAIRGRRRGGDVVEDRSAQVLRAGVVTVEQPRYVWGPVAVHDECLVDLRPPFAWPLNPQQHTLHHQYGDYAQALGEQQMQGLHPTTG